MKSLCILVFLVIPTLQAYGQGLVQAPVRIPAAILKESATNTCPAEQNTTRLKTQLRQNISAILSGLQEGDDCGGGSWRRVGYLDMTDPSQSCPPALSLKSYSPSLRLCGRGGRNSGCWSTFYSTGGSQYSRVCGRVRGYQYGAPSGWFGSAVTSRGIDHSYAAGVSLTHGQIGNRTHIWTFVASLAGVYTGSAQNEFCRCLTPDAPQAPSFVGNDYFCESGLNTAWNSRLGVLYPNDPLWDGQDCPSSCCQFNNPPYFTKTLPAPTTDSIEMRLCTYNSGTTTDVPIDQVEIYIQ